MARAVNHHRPRPQQRLRESRLALDRRRRARGFRGQRVVEQPPGCVAAEADRGRGIGRRSAEDLPARITADQRPRTPVDVNVHGRSLLCLDAFVRVRKRAHGEVEERIKHRASRSSGAACESASTWSCRIFNTPGFYPPAFPYDPAVVGDAVHDDAVKANKNAALVGRRNSLDLLEPLTGLEPVTC